MDISKEKFAPVPKPRISQKFDLPSPGSLASKVLDASINGVYIYDLKLRQHVYANERFTALTGYTLQDLNGFGEKRFYRLFYPEGKRRFFEPEAPDSNGGDDVRDIEYRFKTKHGRWIWCLSHEKVFAREPDGTVSQIIGTVIDITGLKRMREELRQSQSHLSLVLRGVGIGTCLNELPFGHLNWDELTKDLFFIPPEEEPTIETFWDHIHIEDREATRLALEKAIREGTLYEIDHRAVKPETGEIRWIRSIGQATYAEDGTPTRFDGINFDITERKRAEEALRQSETRFRQLADAMPQLVWTADPEGKIEYFNKRCEEYSGIQPMSNGSYRRRPILHEEDLAPTREAWRRAVTTGENYQVEHRVMLVGGDYHWHLSRAVPVRDRSGAITKWFGTTTDIDHVKRTEETLWKLAVYQEQEIAERTRLAEDRAKKLQALAAELIDAEEREKRRISELLHEDLQQVLAAALLQLQSFRDSDQESFTENMERLIKESIAKSRRLSHELSPPMLHHLDLIAALRWVAEQMREQFGLNVELRSSTKRRVRFEPFKAFLFRAARELLFNVFKHAETKNARVELSDLNDHIRLVVSDRGKGFNPDVLRSAAVKEGLGLLSIKERALYLGGKLEIESEPGSGSRLVLTVPVELKNTGERNSFAPEAEGKHIGSKRTGDCIGLNPIRVLFVDDHKVMRQGLIKLIASQPEIEAVGEAANGQEAIGQALRLKPDLILMDVSMPEMDGIEATRRIKKKMPDVRVIGLSMYDDDLIAASMLEAGGEAFLIKTASPSELLKAIYGIERKK